MPPQYLLSRIVTPRDFGVDAPLSQLQQQLLYPRDVFTVLLLLGGNIVERALAQLSGSGFTPVTFSFGWVAYSVSALVAAAGDNKLMPATPDSACKVINGRSGYVINNTSWILGRIIRDFDSWCSEETRNKTAEVLDTKWSELCASEAGAKRPRRAGLVVTVCRPSKLEVAGVPKRDLVFWSGFLSAGIQFVISAIPLWLYGNWTILLITACGTFLALVSGSLPQWKKEKWACRRRSNDQYILTRGNGSQHAIAILANGHGLNLEDLSAGQGNMDVSANVLTRLALFVLCALWIFLLLCAAGIQNDTWFLLAVGSVGIVHNVVVAGCPRRPENFGIHLETEAVFGATKVMKTLLAVEEKYPGIGRSMLGEFFPGQLREDEIKMWAELREKSQKGR
ncbi:hypothetical protein QBC34DRAFT_488593 [Podospora aff. communis PSN243]|uniref:Uncharacterized protein n=1 Tax=Podospora aff. communis PSN243 TaxID=3040156 RepID=A0AAV9G5Y7_9PEZI|nr:hypothetical protein QBC34DRAFT_488593 [Podospora aff. communis PSN243]